MSSEIIKVPDIGGSEGVEIIEISVQAGDTIEAEDTMIVLESDKASMDIPAPKAGKVRKVLVSEGDKVSEGDDILELEAEGGGDADEGDGEADKSDDEQSSVKDSREAEHLEEEAEADESDVEKDKTSKKSSGKGGKRTVEVRVPDIGGSENVEIIEIAVSEGDDISEEDALITLESDKASMDVPSPYSGKLVSLELKEGDTVSEGDLIGTMEIAGDGDDDTDEDTSDDDGDDGADHEEDADVTEDSDDAEDDDSEGGRQELRVPDIGGSDNVEIIEVSISEGDEIGEEDALITLESDKASMDIPSPFKGKVVEVSVKEGDTVSEGDLIGYIEVAGSKPKSASKTSSGDKSNSKKKSDDSAKKSSDSKGKSSSSKKESGKQDEPGSKSKKDEGSYGGEPGPEARRNQGESTAGSSVHAGPAVRLMARELGVELAEVKASGPKGRVLKEDVDAFVKQVMSDRKKGGSASAQPSAQAQGGAGIPPIPAVDFSQFGEIEEKPMGRLMKAGATNLHRSWLNVPHVTQFDEADITELEAFRKAMKDEAAQQGAKLTPLPFMIKAAAHALAKYPQFNVSLHPDGDKLIQKKYFHIGVAVDTPNGLMVPVIRNVDQKGIVELAKEVIDLAGRAQEGKLKRDEMQGGCFTISSLGSIGGTAFTPIVNAPEVAILGVSKSQMKPVWNGSEFKPRLMCPLSLSYDHRAVNGADAARFTAYLASILTDIRRLTM
ncbi:pyruvate dehydrogenase complex dihydrolipoyllysine-residue acetyltransferase [Kushneria marisflavi]|uniref:Acetyltransferase component of pyruvate dehydrogenase complex n=1 Tax=Kushneria marisflavi TaxID=157779 RepID=A0A240UM64_9GAMM|nr:pyruvate dehydrogenase complex dihydrolipoyllysine-residue acetyltransferase [Kushneria marisflavi]ART62216.1 pyruvate dehydrogenase complex dihydrolipoyllysine-residue acetyltransferase [Kushneria marisflavi]RKD87301.1 pyruvate dehydrogenase E2 component (dihydrolipoamide acetyltransferase) [Kushneria marisflavi]